MDLLNTVQPSTGWSCVLGIKEEEAKPRQYLVQTKEEVDRIVEDLLTDNWNIYFGVAKFSTNESRTKSNVHLLKSFWVDIDCGESKAVVNPKTERPSGYIDQATGLQALRDFCEKIGLPDPIVVDSGRGIHAYWPLVEEITKEEWSPIADRLKQLCVIHNFYADPAVTTDAARVLRIPGTFNFKDNPPKEVVVLETAEPTSVSELRTILGVKEDAVAAPKREMSEMAKALSANYVSSFKKIMVRGEDGCRQLLSCYQERATLSEPRWFNALSIAKFCEDKDVAIHKLSKDHPDYDPATTEEKIEHIKGPHGCAEFEKHNSGGCEGCPHKGKIKSPINLGREILEANEEDNTVVVSGDDSGEEDKVHVIPKYPEPYFRGKSGGVYISVEDEDPICIYEHDLYVVKRMRDPERGDMVVIKVHLPADGIRQFTIEAAMMSKLSDLASELSRHGVISLGKKKADAVAMYIAISTKNLQYLKKAEIMRTQFGWADNDSKFILGDREITADGIYHSPPSQITENLSAHLHKAGTLERWKEIFALYGREGMESRAFAALSAFGSPIFKFTGQSGALISLVNAESGTGKSTILYMVNSVYGDPKRLCGQPKDTLNALYMKMGILNNLCYTQDEVTNMPGKVFSDFVYGISQGKGKDRLTSNAELRRNIALWQLLGLITANVSSYDKVAAFKDSADGELMRIIEYTIAPDAVINVEEGKQAFSVDLMKNYGHAGEIYLTYLVNNLEEVKQAVESIQKKIDSELKLTQRERFWSAIVAANIAGGLIARKTGLINWDIKRLYDWASNMIQDLRHDVRPPASSGVAIIGDYLNTYINNTLVVDDGVDQRSKMKAMPKMEPRGELLIRMEPDTNHVFIASKHFKKYCADHQIHYKDTLKTLQGEGYFLGSMNKRLSKGMKITTLPVNCLHFDMKESELAQTIMHVEDDNRESAV